MQLTRPQLITDSIHFVQIDRLRSEQTGNGAALVSVGFKDHPT